MACRHEALLEPGKLSVPTSFSKIYKDECTLCFSNPLDEGGLYVCLSCYNGGCEEHAFLHFSKTGHPLALNIKQTLMDVEPAESPSKMCKIEVNAEPEPKYDQVLQVHCFSCQDSIEMPPFKVKYPRT
jgi:ubiquitin carboxyl-terminal hydrolase 5/13